jgi:hypothetical protein
MSTLPSRPIQFICEIGVMGHGDCKPSLKCPKHRIIEFPAYYYELQDDESPSTPYVGNINLSTVADPNATESLGVGKNGKVRLWSQMGYRLPPKGQLQIVIIFN